MARQELRQSTKAERQFFYGYIVVGAAFLIMMLTYGAHLAFGVFFKPMLAEFGWTRAMTSAAFSLAKVVQGLLTVLMGRLTDRFGPRIVMTLCGFVLGLGYLLMSQAGAMWQLYLFYGVIIGTGMGGAFVPLNTTVARWFVGRRSVMTGIVVSGIGVGLLITPPVASQLISTYDWRLSYIILGAIVLVLVLLAAQHLRRDPTRVGQTPYGEKQGEERELKLATASFSFKEAVYTRQFWVVFAMFFSFGFCMFAVLVHIVPHATDLGISAASAANMLATIGGMSIVGKIVLGSLADRIGNKPVFIVGFILMAGALFWLVSATESWMLYVFAGVFGFAYGGCASSESPLVAGLFGLSSHGAILGGITISVPIGGAVGPFVAGYIFDVTGSYQAAFMVTAAIGLAGLMLTVLLSPAKTSRMRHK